MRDIEQRREQALARIHAYQSLMDVSEHEYPALMSIIDQALEYPEDENRWEAYSVLKEQASTMVGWYARYNALATSAHYEAMVGFIDWLLPENMSDDEDVA